MQIKKYTIGFLLLGVLLSTSCKEDFLQRDPGAPITSEDVFNDPVLASRFADNSYNFLVDDYGRISQAQRHKGTTGQFTDEAIGSGAADFLPYMAVMNQGRFLDPQATDVVEIYGRMYQGIRNVNVMLSKIESVPWTANENPRLIKAQMLFLRGMFYFELAKRYGGVILLDQPLSLTDNPDLPRNSFDETVAFILRDLQEAEGILSEEEFSTSNTTYSPNNDWNIGNYGRPTVGAVKALRSRLLLLAASPLHNPGNDATKWKIAANAAREIMDMDKYNLHTNYATLLNQNATGNNNEYILIKVRGPRPSGGFINDFIVPPSYAGAQGLMNPTQNHVDLYEMKNGKPITDPTSGYNPKDPYKDRDPRFYANIIHNDMTWLKRKVEMWVNNGTNPTSYGRDYQPGSSSYTRTRYYCRKLWPELFDGTPGRTALLNFIFFRYGEVLLNYAEALNEAEGPVTEVYTAINQIRKRAGMPDLPTGLSKDQMRTRIHNERAVELAFEEHRWWDILRWKKGKEILTKTINAMDVEKKGNAFIYTVVPMAAIYQRSFEDHMHLYPIPRDEVDKSQGIMVQNPGW